MTLKFNKIRRDFGLENSVESTNLQSWVYFFALLTANVSPKTSLTSSIFSAAYSARE